MPKLLLRAAAYYQHPSTPQNANNRTSRHGLQQGKMYRCNAPHMILYSLILVSDAEAEEGEGEPLFGSSCPGAENKRVIYVLVYWLYKEVYKHCDLLWDKRGTSFFLICFFKHA